MIEYGLWSLYFREMLKHSSLNVLNLKLITTDTKYIKVSFWSVAWITLNLILIYIKKN